MIQEVKRIPYLKQHKMITDAFWNEFADIHGRIGHSTKDRETTIAALVKIGDIVLTRSPKARTAEFNRNQYVKYKSKLKGYNRYTVCFACPAVAQVRHHIIWIKNGGRNHKRNIVALCRPCHADIHPWLKT